MKTSNKLIILALSILAISLIRYDFRLREEYMKKKPTIIKLDRHKFKIEKSMKE
jgi:hypothetical protein